jgi:hypothetical protein
LQILLCWNNEGGFLNTLAPRAENVASSRGAKLHFLWTNAMCATAARFPWLARTVSTTAEGRVSAVQV